VRVGTYRPSYTYVDRERDQSTSLSYFDARYYLSDLGRFASTDPRSPEDSLSNPQDWNPYSYALNNPIRLADPSGLQPLFPLGLPCHGCTPEQSAKMHDAYAAANAEFVKSFVIALPIALFCSLGGELACGGAFVAGISLSGQPHLKSIDQQVTGCASGDAATCMSIAGGVAGQLAGGAVAGALRGGAASVHGNSLLSEKGQHVYKIVRTDAAGSTEVFKYGISGGRLDAAGLSLRALRQVNALNKAAEGLYTYESSIVGAIPAGPGARLQALALERQLVYGHLSLTGAKPVGNIRP
jgi:RHS repeat-associated protein